MECFTTNIATIPLLPDECSGELKSTNCVIHTNALTYLDLPANSTQAEINEALLLSLQDARNRLAVVESQILDFEARITALEP